MSGSDKTTEELLVELDKLRHELEATAARCGQMEGAAVIADTMLEAACVHGLDSTILHVNQEFERRSGWTSDEAVGKTPVELGLMPMEEWHKLEHEAIPRLLKEGSVRNIETIARCRDGTEFPGLMSWTLVRDGKGKSKGIVSVMRDITERKQIEENLRVSEETISGIIDSAPYSIQVLDPEGYTVRVNQAFLELFGATPPPDYTILNDPHFDRLGPHHNEMIRLAKGERIQFPESYYNTRLVSSQLPDNPLWIRAHGFPLFDGDGNVKNLVLIHDNITERKQAEDMLQQSERRYRLLAENTTDIIFSMDMDLNLTYISPSIERESGFSVEEVMSLPLDQLLTPESMETMISMHTEEMASEETGPKGRHVSRTLELRGYNKDGSTTWIEVHVTLVRDRDGSAIGIQGVARNTTERKNAEEKLQQAYKREAAAHHQLQAEMKRRVEFTRALVHELKTPVTAMMASNTLLVEELPHGPLLRLAANVQQSIANLDKRISEMLKIARGELGLLKLELRHVSPLKVLREAAAAMEATISAHGQTLVSDLQRKLPPAWIDENRLREVVLNLLGNASKFCPEGTVIALRARKDKHSLVVEVEDNGLGLASEHAERIFEPYYRVESDGQRVPGLGLGLALCKRTVEDHGGRIWVRSNEGKGSTFAFSIPLIRGTPDAARQREREK